ncbi:MAG: transcription-repair coupling factor, partial [Candidatus Izemoplasmatales bacterium]
EKPGDYSVRGGIVDVYPLGSLNPIRLDFFGDEIETIKSFDLDTQRSLERVQEVVISPMNEFLYSEKERAQLHELIQYKMSQIPFSEEAKKRIQQDLDDLDNHANLDRLARYIPFLTPNKSTILDLATNPQIWFLDHHRILDQIDLMSSEIGEWYLSTDDYPRMGFDLMYAMTDLRIDHAVYVDYFEYLGVHPQAEKISLFGKEVLSYQGNTKLFVQDMRSEIGRKTLVLAVSSYKERSALTALFEEENIPHMLLGDNDKLRENQVNILINSSYFDLTSDVLNLRVISSQTIFQSKSIRRKGRYVSVYQTSKRLSSVNDLQPGDYVVHYDYGIGKFLEIKTMQMGQTQNDYILIEYRDGDNLYIPIESFSQIQKYAGSEGFVPRLSKLGGADWARAKERVRQKVRDIADQLIKLYSEREHSEGYPFYEFTELEKDFENDFPYEETPDQIKAIQDVLMDMTKPKPMDRLLCGDVGFGKTEVALRAAFRAVLNGKQVAYLAPTTVLANQHYKTFQARMEKYGVRVELLNRFVMPKKQTEVLKGVQEGVVDILIGTHRILSQDVSFKDLGLLVIDEEQRFGVLHKERIKEMKVSVDVLSLSATPIPRTLQMAIMGVKNMSLLETAPENRYPIQTYVLERNDILIRDAIERELMRSGQVFYLYNRIEDIENVADRIQKLVPQARIAIAHGQMHKHMLERVVEDFIAQETDVLLSTTIIETGIDIPNANTLIIHDADRLGLAQLYQIRGRVGRSSRIAYAYLMYHKNKTLTEDAEKRLKVIKEFTELGSGFKIAIRDLSIRGAGDVLGAEQSGFIDSVGVDLYMRILEEEIKTKQGTVEEKAPAKGVKATVSKYIDKEYIESDFVKIEMHQKIQGLSTLAQLEDLSQELRDRFGHVDEELEIYMRERLFEVHTKRLGVERITEAKTNITLVVSVEGSLKIAGEQLFLRGGEISPYLRFAYKEDKIRIILDTVSLDRHWLFTMVAFLDAILISQA